MAGDYLKKAREYKAEFRMIKSHLYDMLNNDFKYYIYIFYTIYIYIYIYNKENILI
jgi:hypothetical protein